MKKIYYLIGVVGALCFSACSSDFLDGEYSEYTQDNEMGASAASSILTGAYTSIFNPEQSESHDDFGLKAIELLTDMMADDMAMNQSAFYVFDYQNDYRASGYRRTRAVWAELYAIIRSTNTALTYLANEDVTDAKIQRLSGEARALRAYSYFVLINMYQQPYNVDKTAPGIPIYTETGSKPGRNTVNEVYELIVGDLLKAHELLKGKGGSKATVLDEYSVAGMLARVLCFVNDHPNQWAEVARFADLATKGRSLSTEKQLTGGMNNLETMGEAMWGSAISAINKMYYNTYMSHMDPFSNGYGGSALGFKEIASELYGKIDNNDIRKGWFLAKDSMHVYSGSAEATKIPKYTQVKFQDEGGFTSDNIYMRVAEMYFVKAEALFLNGNEAGAKQALTDVMSTRVAGYATTNTGDALLKEIRIQKRIELWGEGRRLFDMKWRGEAMDRTGSPNHNQEYTLTFPANPKEYVYQIPDKEMDANENIEVQNP